MATRRRPVPLPSPEVRFGADFLPRVGRMTARVASARERREGAGRHALVGVGAELVGHRPYRPGEDLRQLDWALLARLDRPFVRLARREASEHWAVLVDASASMGTGVPGKLQWAAEVATGIAALGLRGGATVELLVSPGEEGGAPRTLVLSKELHLSAWTALLEATRAGGTAGLAALVREPARVRAAGRVFAVGDLLDLHPEDLLRLARRGRELFAAQVLAPDELAAPAGAVEWIDAETGARQTLDVDARTAARYERELGRRLEAWRSTCARHRVAHGVWASSAPFEEACADLLGG